jgi:hypothetical protein
VNSLAVVIKIPAEAVVPLLIGTAALLVLLFAGSALASWKAKSPGAASKFGLVVAILLTGASIYFLARGLTNQSDPNNEGTGQINFTDAPIAGFLGAVSAAFWRMANLQIGSAIVGVGIGGLMLVKPFVWPVIVTYDGHSRQRGMMDPEHIMFLGPAIVVIVVALVAWRKPSS